MTKAQIENIKIIANSKYYRGPIMPFYEVSILFLGVLEYAFIVICVALLATV